MAAEPGSVRFARSEILRWFHDQGRADDGLATSIALAVSEAVANVVRHAYPRTGAGGRVEVEAELEDRSIVVSVADGGAGLTGQTERERNGMGLPVIGRMADGVTVVSDETGTRVTMRFDLDRGPQRGAFLRPNPDRTYAIGVP